MKNIVLEGYIYAGYMEYSKEFYYTFVGMKGSESNKSFVEAGYIPIAPYCIEIELPEGIDLHKGQLVGLQHQRKLILAQNQGKLNEIDAKIQEFMAIESKPWQI